MRIFSVMQISLGHLAIKLQLRERYQKGRSRPIGENETLSYASWMRLLYTLFSLAIGGYGLYWFSEKNPTLREKIEETLSYRTTHALETRFDAHQVMDAHQRRLLKEKGSRYLDPELKFFPYLLIEVKYSDSRGKTREELILWDLTDGEMVLDTKMWEKTHGFADCMLTRAQSGEFKILQLLADYPGGADISLILAKTGLESPILEVFLRGLVRKNLVLQQGESRYRLHLDHPRLTLEPKTKLYDSLTTRPHRSAICATKHFSKSQVERMAQAAFGDTFSIRSTTEIYLPVHRIVIQSADGEVRTFHFNALTGKELPPAPFYQ